MMPIPDFESLMLPLLKLAGDGNRHSNADAVEALARTFNLSSDEKLQLQPSGTESIFRNRLRWSRWYLTKAGLLETVTGGAFQIKQRGKDVVAEGRDRIDVKYLMRFPEFVEATRRKTVPEAVSAKPESKSPEDILNEAYEELRNDLEREVMSRVRQNSAQFFETLVVDLIRAMGYGVDYQVLGRSGDGGVDGLIKEDKLGLSEIYLQAKRWEGNVPVGEVRSFAGALQERKSSKGIFITTSDFSQDARGYVEKIGTKIRLINGTELARLMIDYDMGVKTKNRFDVKKVDEDYFLD
jgi:restriction system protein